MDNSVRGNATAKELQATSNTRVQDIANDLAILESGLFANIEVTCADTGKTFKVHKSVLCERSRYFKSALTGGYEETFSGKLTIHDFKTEEMGLFFDFMYRRSESRLDNFDYLTQLNWRKDSMFASPYRFFELCVILHNLGDYFQVDFLVKYALDKMMHYCDMTVVDFFTATVPAHVGTTSVRSLNRHMPMSQWMFVGILPEANYHKYDPKALWAKAISEIAAGVTAAYSAGAPKNAARLVLASVVSVLVPRLADEHANAFVKVMEEFPDFAQDFALVTLKGLKGPWTLPADKRSNDMTGQPKLDVDCPGRCRGCRHLFARRKAVVDPMSIRNYVGVAWCFHCTSERRKMVEAPWRRADA